MVFGVILGVSVAAVAGCYGHYVSHGLAPRPVPAVPSLVGPMTGAYVLSKEGQRIGREIFTITASAGVWRVEGEATIDGTGGLKRGYVLEFSEKSLEPVRFRAWIALGPMRRTTIGELDKGYFTVTSTGVGRPFSRKIPYAAGTAIDLETPMTSTPQLSLLLPGMEPEKKVHVRTLVVGGAMLEPHIELQSYVLKKRDDPAIVWIESRRGTGHYRVRKDGLPVSATLANGTGVTLSSTGTKTSTRTRLERSEFSGSGSQ